MKIAFVIADLQVGGAQNVGALLCNAWAASGHDVRLITFDPAELPPYYSLDPRIALLQMGLPGRDRRTLSVLKTNVRRISALRGEFRRNMPDAIIAFMPEANVVSLLAGKGLPTPVFVSERIDPASLSLGWIRETARALAYCHAAGVVVQTPEIGDYVAARFKARPVVLPNPVPLEQFRRACERAASRQRLIVGAGRLERQKGFDLLLEAFAGLAPEWVNWNLCIHGEGRERAGLQSRIQDLGLGDRVSLPGVCRDVPAAFAAADILVHPSRFEGLSNVIMEALAAGLPVIATDCPGGSAALLGHGRYGRLVPVDDIAALRREMADLMMNDDLRRSLGGAAPQAVQDYDVPIVAERWIELISNIAVSQAA